jgi:hypothetical protein
MSWVIGLKDFYSKYEAEYLFQVQFSRESSRTNPLSTLEKSGMPRSTLGRRWPKLLFRSKTRFIPARKASWEDHIRLDPWHGLKNLQPLGSSNRLRRIVYPASAALRHKMNARKEINVTSIDQIPDGGYVEA